MAEGSRAALFVDHTSSRLSGLNSGTWSAADHAAMANALQLAARGLYSTSPNPRVGCVIVRDGELVGSGWHKIAGEPHAEIHALEEAGQQARGATLYVTLEPCAHHGRTPPCADAIIASGVTRVVAAMADPNPLVAGRGLRALGEAGIETSVGLYEAQARALNVGFISRMTRRRPWLRIKIAATLDGKTALANGISKWITSPAARRDVHRLRARSCAIMTGSGTVLADDPELTVRETLTPRQPLRVVLDSQLRTPLAARIVGPNTLFVAVRQDVQKEEALKTLGAEVIYLESQGKPELEPVLNLLAERGVNELLVEAGSELNAALLQAKLVDEIVCYVAPTLFGHGARGMFAIDDIIKMDDRIDLALLGQRRVGPDWRINARPLYG